MLCHSRKQLILLVSLCSFSAAFQNGGAFLPHARVLSTASSASALMAKKKKKKKGTAGQGFGEVREPVQTKSTEVEDTPLSTNSPGLQGLEGGSDVIPTFAAESGSDPNMSPEERTQLLLREKYGMRTFEDQQREEKLKENARRFQELKSLADEEDFDLMQVIPAPILVAFDSFLKIGLAITTVLFIAAGCGITAEAWSASSGNPLPEDIDNFIVNTIEPNFTPGLFVLLSFSVTLGIFSALQLGSSSSQYKEGP